MVEWKALSKQEVTGISRYTSGLVSDIPVWTSHISFQVPVGVIHTEIFCRFQSWSSILYPMMFWLWMDRNTNLWFMNVFYLKTNILFPINNQEIVIYIFISLRSREREKKREFQSHLALHPKSLCWLRPGWPRVGCQKHSPGLPGHGGRNAMTGTITAASQGMH